MTKLEKLRIAAVHNYGRAEDESNTSWIFPTTYDYLQFLDEVEGAGMQRPVDFGSFGSGLAAWAVEPTKDEEL